MVFDLSIWDKISITKVILPYPLEVEIEIHPIRIMSFLLKPTKILIRTPY